MEPESLPPQLRAELLFALVRVPAFLAGQPTAPLDIEFPDRALSDVKAGVRRYLLGHREGLPHLDLQWVFHLPKSIPEESFGAVQDMPLDVVMPFTNMAQKALKYLQDLIPTRILPGLALKDASMTHAERAKLRRAAQAIDDPVGTLRAVEMLSSDHIKAIREVYPGLHRKVVEIVGTALAERSRPVTGRENVSLSRLMGAPLHSLPILQPSEKDKESNQAMTGTKSYKPRGPVALEPDVQTSVQSLQDSTHRRPHQ
jgi:hypothetical protein